MPPNLVAIVQEVGTILDLQGNLVGKIDKNGLPISNDGFLLGTVTQDNDVIANKIKGNIIGKIEKSKPVSFRGKPIGKVLKGYVVDTNGEYVGRIESNFVVQLT